MQPGPTEWIECIEDILNEIRTFERPRQSNRGTRVEIESYDTRFFPRSSNVGNEADTVCSSQKLVAHPRVVLSNLLANMTDVPTQIQTLKRDARDHCGAVEPKLNSMAIDH